MQLFTLRRGKHRGPARILLEDLPRDNFNPATFLSEVLGQYYSSDYVPKEIYVPVDFEDRTLLKRR